MAILACRRSRRVHAIGTTRAGGAAGRGGAGAGARGAAGRATAAGAAGRAASTARAGGGPTAAARTVVVVVVARAPLIGRARLSHNRAAKQSEGHPHNRIQSHQFAPSSAPPG
ncbi:MAG: hypothetical protein DRI90_26955 [Deltaproteobacteria bacterium]|nr:MAG: hypothetical protein DRI90_26955 [Deltaproteobacteria bacterium]